MKDRVNEAVYAPTHADPTDSNVGEPYLPMDAEAPGRAGRVNPVRGLLPVKK